ncbi:uncharacterized protein IWZ02DRAFT_315921 [Phyllosticta citriasiana]|uniref:Uncharacterized protein n=1 Tax=Phyllosticta citriasiana TaxID=595635 RepID=A0ABR1KZ42_9PEZI
MLFVIQKRLSGARRVDAAASMGQGGASTSPRACTFRFGWRDGVWRSGRAAVVGSPLGYGFGLRWCLLSSFDTLLASVSFSCTHHHRRSCLYTYPEIPLSCFFVHGNQNHNHTKTSLSLPTSTSPNTRTNQNVTSLLYPSIHSYIHTSNPPAHLSHRPALPSPALPYPHTLPPNYPTHRIFPILLPSTRKRRCLPLPQPFSIRPSLPDSLAAFKVATASQPAVRIGALRERRPRSGGSSERSLGALVAVDHRWEGRKGGRAWRRALVMWCELASQVSLC